MFDKIITLFPFDSLKPEKHAIAPDTHYHLSALEKVKYGKIYTEIYGIVAGETLDQMQYIEQRLQEKGLHCLS